jgi:hypothetical protein
MQTLNFRLKPFRRISWITEQVADAWNERIDRINQAFRNAEIEAVFQGHRRAALVNMNSMEFADVLIRTVNTSLLAVPIEMEASLADGGGPMNINHFTVLLSEVSVVGLLQDAIKQKDHQAMGQYLGYPDCCVSFYQQHQHMSSLLWPTAEQTAEDNKTDRELTGHAWLNPMLKVLGVRMISHWACSDHCQASLKMAAVNRQLMIDDGQQQTVDWLEQMLSWPMKWSALHGIAEIRLPVARIAHNTDATPLNHTVTRTGAEQPEEGATGSGFPYAQQPVKKLTNRKLFIRGQQHPEQQLGDRLWLDNGFQTEAGMKGEQHWVTEGLQGLTDTGAGLHARWIGHADQSLVSLVIELK